MADKEVTYSVKVHGESDTGQAANAVEVLRARLVESQNAIKQYSAALRNLRGDSEAVTKAKEGLKASLQAERDKVSANTLTLIAHGAGLQKAKVEVERLKKMQDEARKTGEALGGVWKALAVAAAGFTIAVAAGAVALAKWALEGANALRTMGLFREAATGSAANASALGHQIELLGTKVPQSREELNRMAVELSRAFMGTRVGGQGLVDTFNAVAQASAAMGDQAGAKIQEIIDRSKQWGRLGIGMFELQGTGIGFHDVAAQLAKNLGISLKAAQNQLFMGRANVNAGAKAIRDAIEKNFAGINARRMLDLNVLAVKFKDTLQALTSDIDFTGMASAIKDLFGLFGEGTVTGKALKGIITDVGNAIGAAFKGATPFVRTFVQAFVVEMLRFESALLDAAIFVKEKFGFNVIKSFDETGAAMFLAHTAAIALEGALIAVAATTALLVAGAFAVKAAVDSIRESLRQWAKDFAYGDWVAAGRSIIDGLLAGLNPGQAIMNTAVGKLADGMISTIKNKLGSHSPSLVFKQIGKDTAEGYAQGVEGSDRPQAAVGAMVTPPSAGGANAGGGASITIGEIKIEVKAGGRGGDDIARSLTSADFKARFTKLLQEVAISAGIAPQKAPA